MILGQEHFLSTKNKIFEFTWEGQNQLDSITLYKIGFQLTDSSLINTEYYNISSYSGHLYINTADYAIIKYECTIASENTIIHQNVNYRRFEDQYSLFQSSIEMINTSKDGTTHIANIDLTVNNVSYGKKQNIDQSSISRHYLASIPYNRSYWTQLG